MIRYLIKNNFKLMFRNKWSLAVMVLGPVIVIAVLSSAFTQLMKSYEGVDEFTAGYRMEKTEEAMGEVLKAAGEEAGILFYEYPQGDIEELMQKNELAGFVEFSEDTYTVYQSADYEAESITLEYFMSRLMNARLDASLQLAGETEIVLPFEQLEYMPAVDSVDYYGIIYIVYFCWCGIICGTGVFHNEKKYGIARRFQVSNLSEAQIYFARFIPAVLTTAGGMAIATVITALLYQIHWGRPLVSILVVFMMILAGIALGMMFYSISDSMVITIILLFTVVWIMGFLGGSFETYMFSNISDTLKNLSPIYYGNRALVELSCMGRSDYVQSAVSYSLVITVICSIVAMFAGYIRKRGKA